MNWSRIRVEVLRLGVRAGTNFKTVTENLHVRARICSAKRM